MTGPPPRNVKTNILLYISKFQWSIISKCQIYHSNIFLQRDLLALRYEGDQDLSDYFDQLESVLAGLEEDVQECSEREDAYTCTTDVVNEAQEQVAEIVASLFISNPYVGYQAGVVIANCVGGAGNFLKAIEPVKTVEIVPIKPLNNNYDGASALECIRVSFY